MEVHHHPHVEKKSFKEYFLEYLMIVLAVTTGFFAESFRESRHENHIEKEFIESFVQDLKADTAKLRNGILSNTQKVSGIDSLLNNIYHTPYTDSSLRIMYYLQRRYGASNLNVYFTNRTLIQLKYSGSLRYIRNKAAADSIVLYDESIQRAERQGDGVRDNFQAKATEMSHTIFDAIYTKDYNRFTVFNFLKTNTKVKLMTDDQKALHEYANKISATKGGLENYLAQLKTQQKRAVSNINFLEKEYGLSSDHH